MKAAFGGAAAIFSMAWKVSRGKILLSVVLMTLAGASWPLLALALRSGVDAVVGRNAGAALTAGLLIGVGVMAVLLLQHFAYVPYAEAAEIATVSLELELIDLANGSAGLEHHERPEYDDRITVLRNELPQFYDGLVGVLSLLSLLVSLGITGYLLLLLNPWLLLLPVSAVCPVLAGRRAQNIVNRAKEESASVTRQANHLFELATSARPAKEVRVLRLQAELERRHVRLWGRAGDALWAAEKRAALIAAAGQAVFGIAYVSAVLLVLRQAVAGRGQVGDIVLVITLAVQVNQQITAGLDLFRKLLRMAHGMARLEWLREFVAHREPPEATATVPESTTAGIELRNVGFSYPGTDRPVLSGVDLTLPAGSTVAIVGENGAGKSTLINLLCRFYETTTGEIRHDSVNIQRYPLTGWRGRIAAGYQNFVRFELSAQQAVGVGDLPHADDPGRVRTALHRAHAEGVIDKLEEGLATQLGKSWTDGTELSGGQWQKLAIARAMMREQALLLVLDEPTSALDAEAEHLLFEQYAANARRVGERTGAITVFVSHRFSTVQMADVIVVLARGRVAEVGDHRTLVAANGLYAELYALQASAYR